MIVDARAPGLVGGCTFTVYTYVADGRIRTEYLVPAFLFLLDAAL